MKMKIIYYLIFLHLGFNLKGQELNAQVIVNSDLVNQTNQQIFKTLERALNEFINTQVWTNKDFLNQERISCSFVFILRYLYFDDLVVLVHYDLFEKLWVFL